VVSELPNDPIRDKDIENLTRLPGQSTAHLFQEELEELVDIAPERVS